MTDMTFLCFAGFIGFFSHLVFIKLCYFKHEAICLRWTLARKHLFVTHPLYEYILVEKDKIVTYHCSGTTIFYPKKGKKYNVLIRKTDHTKVIGYGGVVLEFCWALFFLLGVIWDIYYYLN